MKTRTITLNARSNASFPWPGRSLYDGCLTNAQCCIGQAMRVCGVPLDLLYQEGYPESVYDRASGQYSHDGPPWSLTVPEDVFADISNAIMGYPVDVTSRRADRVAAFLNDYIAREYGHMYEAVEGIRVLFRWVGEQVGERWIVRYYPEEAA